LEPSEGFSPNQNRETEGFQVFLLGLQELSFFLKRKGSVFEPPTCCLRGFRFRLSLCPLGLKEVYKGLQGSRYQQRLAPSASRSTG